MSRFFFARQFTIARAPARLRAMRTRIALVVAALVWHAALPMRAQTPDAQTPSGTAEKPAAIRPRPVGTMSQLMVDVIYPASNAVFYLETRLPTTTEEWRTLQGQALMVAEAGNLLMMPGYARD